MKKFLTLILLSMLSVSCIYDYDLAEVEEEKKVVIEGDIIIGGTSYVRATYVMPMSSGSTVPIPVPGAALIENEKGDVWKASLSLDTGEAEFDLSTAPDDCRYRLRVNISGGEAYQSEWSEVCPAPEIEDVSFVVNQEESKVDLKMNLSSDYESGCYRWDYEETWKYHANFYPLYEYDPVGRTLINHDDPQNRDIDWWPYYWCWMHTSSRRAGVEIAKSLEGNALVDYVFMNYALTDGRFMDLYRIELKARSISEECYRYLDTINQYSDLSGSLLSPNPSEMIGNIRNVNDEDDYAIGYVGASKLARKVLYIDGRKFYTGNTAKDFQLFNPLDAIDNGSYEDKFYSAYLGGARPVDDYFGDGIVMWTYLRCIDCRSQGGVLEEPDGWGEY